MISNTLAGSGPGFQNVWGTPRGLRTYEPAGRLRHHTIMFKLGYGDRIRAMGFTALKNRYPEAHEPFEREPISISGALVMCS
jgi:hypothetical protein